MSRVLHESARRLKSCRRSTAVLGAARYLLRIVTLLSAAAVQNLLRGAGLLQDTDSALPNRGDLFLAAALLTALLICTPLRMQTDWQIGRLAGTLDENDLGFLAHSGNVWLWCRAIGTRLLMETVIVLSAFPALLLGYAAKSIWLMIPPEEEGLLPLLTVLHLGFLAAAAVLLPLRALAASSALPYCYLRMPHRSAWVILHSAFRYSRGQSGGIVLARMLSAPLLLLPIAAVWLLPVLLASEQLRCVSAQRRLETRPRSRFSGLELHAA